MMMMKDLGFNEDISNNFTSTISGETNISSTTTNTAMLCPQQASSSSFISPPPNQPPTKKKRGLPGNPDPDAEVIALSPKSLLATNRFICEICNKGFQRDQNLQLHRRGHNLPWKLKQRDKDQVVRKKVYVCPVPTCVHHDPARALGDLTGIKKHYCRKHGEKKWKCNKCSKKYAVQSDWKAHSKICGTREYRCDCGTLFSRRDSFITHRAFCDALTGAGRGGGSSTTLPNLISQLPTHLSSNLHNPLHSLPLKREHDDQHLNFNIRQDIPPWLACPPPPLPPQQAALNPRQHSQQAGLEPGHPLMPSSQMDDHLFLFQQLNNQYQHHLHDPSQGLDHAGSTLPSFQTLPPSHISATALLQRAVEVGVTINNNNNQQQQQQYFHYQQHQHQNRQVSSHGAMSSTSNSNKTQPHTHVSMGISSSREGDHHHHHANTGFMEGQVVTSQGGEAQSSMLHDMMIMSSFQSSTSPKRGSGLDAPPAFGDFHQQHHRQGVATPKPPPPFEGGKSGGGGGGGGEGLTRDFLGLRTYFHKDFINMAGLGGHMNSTSSSSAAQFDHQQFDHQNQTPW